ncbi:MAG: UDP-2,3-diacylglucosamine diphosphatase LpxI [Hyphomicrobiaceae bacterium]
MKPDASGPLGILAASGPLPLEIAATAQAKGRAVFIVALTGLADADGVARHPHAWASLGQVGRILGSFKSAGCRDLVIAGAMQRPDLMRLRIDLGFLRNFGTVLALTRGGDDSVLRKVVRFFEGHGFHVCGVGDVAPQLLATTGPLGALSPDPDHLAAIARAKALLAALGPFDVGQGAVVTRARIVAVEGVRGTDAMLRELAREGAGAGIGAGAVLVKLPKPGQERRVDLPTIGPVTVARAVSAGLAGIAVGAGASLVMQREEARRAADAAGIFVVGLDDDAGDAEAPAVATTIDTPFAILARRAPTPKDRADIALARKLVLTLRAHGAGRAGIIGGEHVLAIAGALPVTAMLRASAAHGHWGLRRLKGQIGTLLIDLAPGHDGTTPPISQLLDIEVLRAARDARLSGIACLGAPLPDDLKNDAIAWADEAKLFLVTDHP